MTRFLTALAIGLWATTSWGSGLRLEHAWVRALPGTLPAAGYFTLHNDGPQATALVRAVASGFGKVTLHRSIEHNGQEHMIVVSRIEIPPGSQLTFSPGAYHIMFMSPKQPLKIGDYLPVTLIFSDGRRLEARFPIRGPSGAPDK